MKSGTQALLLGRRRAKEHSANKILRHLHPTTVHPYDPGDWLHLRDATGGTSVLPCDLQPVHMWRLLWAGFGNEQCWGVWCQLRREAAYTRAMRAAQILRRHGNCSCSLYVLKADTEINDLKGCCAIYLLKKDFFFFFWQKPKPEKNGSWPIWWVPSWFLWKCSLKYQNDSFCWMSRW